MAKRKRIALIYAYNENWIGGTYYIENLITALAQLPDDKQPELIIFCWDATDANRLQQAVSYLHWSFRRFERTLSLPERIINKLTAVTIGKRYISSFYKDVDLVFPLLTGWRPYFIRVLHHLYWIPDFQEHYLPDFFELQEIQERKAEQQVLLQVAQHLVFSSYAAKGDFNEIYHNSGLKEYVLQFAVTTRPALDKTAACLAQYDINQPYFICSNQFWKHKNHETVLKALVELRHIDPNVLIVFTGKEHDYRNPLYFGELMALKEELNLYNEVKFLGFIPRQDQLTLMKSAVAVIQPSLFEGWSTVVEDAKSLNVPLITSDISVHQEQLADYSAKLFFEPKDYNRLAICMAEALDKKIPTQPYNYQNNVLQFAQNFMNIVYGIVGE
jgi:glycosyltransferase involved in cell wall biosynthesis